MPSATNAREIYVSHVLGLASRLKPIQQLVEALCVPIPAAYFLYLEAHIDCLASLLKLSYAIMRYSGLHDAESGSLH
jgi:hypothetical protein